VDIRTLVENMRQADRNELAAATSATLTQVVSGSVKRAVYSKAGFVGDDLVCIFGLGKPASLLDDKGIPWMLGTPLIEQHSRLFLRHGKKQLKIMLGIHPKMENWVYSKNETAIEWLKWLGFQFHDPQPWGWQGEYFHRFSYPKEGS
jgi:hypothetical protein